MRAKKSVFYLLAVLLSGCLPSLHPLYTPETLIFEEKLVGKWIEKDGSNIWEFRKTGEQKYEMRLFDGKEGRFEAHLIELGGMMFLDVFPDGEVLGNPQEFYKIHILPAHTFMKVNQIEPNLQLQMMNPDVSEMLKDDPNLLQHELIADDSIVLTASTEQLQEFMLKYANTEGVFSNAIELTRLEPLYAEENVVFDENLVGEWIGKDGEVLDLIQIEEEMAYDVIYVTKDGEEQQYFAHLVKLEGMMFLGVFSDKSLLQQKDSQGLHFVPDIFLKVDQTEPKLLLQQIDHQEVPEILKSCQAPLKQEAAKTHYCFEGVRIEP